MLPSVSAVSRSACRLGASGFSVRPSCRGLGGFVAAVGFSRPALAAQFACAWASRLPAGCRWCVVKRAGGFSWVSVPILPSSAPVLCRAGSPVSVVGAPSAVRSAVVSGGVWAW
jgi:hypothetical protein